MSNEELWDKTTKLASEIPFVFSSPYYAHKEAAQKIAEDLPAKKAEEFLRYAYERYKSKSNYAGD